LLLNDICLDGIEWVPIGVFSTMSHINRPFLGNFNGNDFVIRNYMITTHLHSDIGLFGYNEGIIRNLGIKNFSIKIRPQADSFSMHSAGIGGLVGRNSGTGQVTNCFANGKILIDFTSSSIGELPTDLPSSIGGLVGQGGRIINSFADVNISISVTAAIENATIHVGGLVGQVGSVTNSYALGGVSIILTARLGNGFGSVFNVSAGGLVGSTIGTGGTISNSFSIGNVSVETATLGSSYVSSRVFVGGLIGRSNANSTTVINCFARGDVSVIVTRVGAGSVANAFVGGLVGEFVGLLLENCYATGNLFVSAIGTGVDHEIRAGGLVGSSNIATLRNNFATGNITTISPNPPAGSTRNNVGGSLGTGTSPNSHVRRFEGQSFSRTVGPTTYATPSNATGLFISLAELNSIEFYTDTLGWCDEIWSLENLDIEQGLLPTLSVFKESVG
jgi:hypothetical protein